MHVVCCSLLLCGVFVCCLVPLVFWCVLFVVCGLLRVMICCDIFFLLFVVCCLVCVVLCCLLCWCSLLMVVVGCMLSVVNSRLYVVCFC